MKTKQGNKTAAQIYLDWTNNYLSLEVFAKDYGWTYRKARRVIEAGRIEHETNVAARSKFVWPDGRVRPVRNLAPLLRRAHNVVSVTVRELDKGKALLLAVLPDGVIYEALFESFTVCRDFATSPCRAWFGVPISIQEIPGNPEYERLVALKKSYTIETIS